MQTLYLPAMFEVEFDHRSWKPVLGREARDLLWVAMETTVGKQEVSVKERGVRFLALVHLLKEFVGGVFIAMVLHLTELPFLWAQHGVHLQRK